MRPAATNALAKELLLGERDHDVNLGVAIKQGLDEQQIRTAGRRAETDFCVERVQRLIDELSGQRLHLRSETGIARPGRSIMCPVNAMTVGGLSNSSTRCGTGKPYSCRSRICRAGGTTIDGSLRDARANSSNARIASGSLFR